MGGGAWPLFVSGMISLVNYINERDFDSLCRAMYGSCEDLCASNPPSLDHGGGEVCEQAACAQIKQSQGSYTVELGELEGNKSGGKKTKQYPNGDGG